MKKLILISFVFSVLAIFRCTGQSRVDYTHWTLAHILHDYAASPVYDAFITGGPVIERLDSIGGSLLFYLTPQSNHDCRQAFRVGWRFNQPVNDLEEGQNVEVEVFSYPVIDTVMTIMDCYRASKEEAGNTQWLGIRFIGGDSSGLASKSELAFYWSKASPVLFKLDLPIEATSGFAITGTSTTSSSGTFLVQDLDNNPSTANVPFGTLTFEISKKGVFDFRVLYLYDGMESEVSPAGAHRLLIDKLAVEHTIKAGKDEPVMNIALMGLLDEAVGREVRIVIHVMDGYRRPLPGIQGDTAFCDRAGYVVAYSPMERISSRQYYLHELIIPIPYYALNLPTSQNGHLINLYAEVFLDGKSIGMSRMTQTTFFW